MLNRRQAISSMALFTGAAFVPASCAIEDKPKKEGRFFYSLNTSTISGNSPGIGKYIEVASEAGYDYIEVWVRDVEAYLSNGKSLSSLKKKIDDSGLKVASAIGFAPWMTGGEDGFAQMEKEMKMLAGIGCPRIAAPPAGVDAEEELDFFEVGTRLSRLIELGKKTGVMPQLEFWGASPSLWHLGQVLMIAAAANHPDVKILPDIYHLFRGGSGFESLKMLNGRIIDIFHLNDYPGNIPREEQTDADRVYPGDGVAPVKQILTDLYNMGGDKILSLELFNRSYWELGELEVARTGLNKMKSLVQEVVE